MKRRSILKLLYWHAAVFLLLCLFSAWALSGVLPDEAGVAVRSVHGQYNSGPQALNNDTHGLYAIWDVKETRGFKFRALAAAMKLSNYRDGVAVGGMVERGPFFASAGAVRGYQSVTYGNIQLPGSRFLCAGYCYWHSARTIVAPFLAVGVRFDLTDRWLVRLSLQPKPPRESDAFLDTRKDTRRAASMTLWVGRRF